MRLVPTSRVHSLFVAAGLVVAVTACGNKKSSSGDSSSQHPPSEPGPKTFLTMDDYKSVCVDGKGVEGAVAYEKKPGAPSPFAYMYKDTALGDPKAATFTSKIDSTTKPWQADDAKEVQLVACVDVAKAEKDHDCEFDKGGKMERFRTTLKIAVHEAKTGKKLGEQTVEKKVPGCPMFAFIDKKAESNRDYGALAPEVLSVVAEYQPADVPQPKMHAETFERACNGKPAIGAGKPSTEKGKYNPFVTFLREKDGPWRHGEVNNYYFGEHDWFEPNLNAQSNEKEPKTSIAVCMTSTRGAKFRDCEFTSGSSLAVYQASWKVDVVEASTGKVLQTKAFTGKAECPTIWSFDRGKEFDAEPGDDLKDWLRPVVSPK